MSALGGDDADSPRSALRGAAYIGRLLPHIRLFPGYRSARRTVVVRLQRSTFVRKAIYRGAQFAPRPAVPLDIKSGNLLAGQGTDRLPIVVAVLLGLEPTGVGPVVAEIARLQVLTAGFRPVIVMDVPELGAARDFGYPAELLIGAEQWDDSDGPREHYLRVRLASIFAIYGSTASITVGPEGLRDTDRLILASLTAP